jgi:hypothetical protein
MALVVAAAVAAIGGGDETGSGTTTTSTTIPPPIAFDPETALPVFETTTGDADVAARQYFESRVPDVGDDLTWEAVATASPTTAYFRWEAVGFAAPVTGDLFLRADAGRGTWDVVGAFTDTIIITELGHDGDAARIEGVVPEDRAAAIIATTVDGTEVLDEAIESPRFSREVDARTGVTFRVQLRDDVVYALSELRADPPP